MPLVSIYMQNFKQLAEQVCLSVTLYMLGKHMLNDVCFIPIFGNHSASQTNVFVFYDTEEPLQEK